MFRLKLEGIMRPIEIYSEEALATVYFIKKRFEVSNPFTLSMFIYSMEYVKIDLFYYNNMKCHLLHYSSYVYRDELGLYIVEVLLLKLVASRIAMFDIFPPNS
jgi:hypothetical protein